MMQVTPEATQGSATTTQPTPPTADPMAGPGGLLSMLPPIILCFAVFYFMIIRPQKKQQQALRNMLDNLKKNDNVRFSGGILGKIAAIDKDKNIVTIKLDDQGNLRVRVLRTAIETVIPDDKAAPEPEPAKQKSEVK